MSYLKKDWQLNDYPILYKNNSSLDIENPKRFKPIPWVARIAGWNQMQGHGDTKQEARIDLEKKFQEIKAREPLPRPGRDVPLSFASNEGIKKYSNLTNDFFKKIIDARYSEVFLSDESSIWDFVMDDTLDQYYKKIKDIYGVDVSDTDGNFLEIFKKINKVNIEVKN